LLRTLRYMAESTVLLHAGKLHVFQRCNATDPDRRAFFERVWMVLKNKHVPNIDALSKAWVAVRYQGASYDTDIMSEVRSLEKTLYEF
jgi:hypothetical protein